MGSFAKYNLYRKHPSFLCRKEGAFSSSKSRYRGGNHGRCTHIIGVVEGWNIITIPVRNTRVGTINS